MIYCFINLQLDTSTYGAMLCVFTSLAIISVVPVAFIVMAVVISKHHAANTLETQYFKDNYGTIIQGLNLYSFIELYWNIIIIIRWTITIAVLVSLRDYVSLQIIILRVTSFTVMILVIAGCPNDNMTDNYMALFNEAMV